MASTPTKIPTQPTVLAPTPTPPATPTPVPTIAGEVPLTVEQHAYLANKGTLMVEEKKILLKRTVTPNEAKFLNKKMEIEKKLVSGEYKSLAEMATDINGGTPCKEIDDIIFQNMMKIMIREFNA